MDNILCAETSLEEQKRRFQAMMPNTSFKSLLWADDGDDDGSGDPPIKPLRPLEKS